MKNCLQIVRTAIVISAVAVVFYPCLKLGLCSCDDTAYVLAYDFVTKGLSFDGILTAFRFVEQSIWMPLTWFSYMVDYSCGWGPEGMHLVNLALHIFNSLLLLMIVMRIIKPQKAWQTVLAMAITLFWAIHPLRVESVVWIASRKDELSTLFLLAAIYTWIGGRSYWREALAAAFVLLGALAKPSVMVFPAFAVAFDLFIVRNRRPLYIYAALVAISIGIAAEATWAQGVIAMDFSASIPFWYKLVNAFAALTIYIDNLLWPDKLGVQFMIRYPSAPLWSLIGMVFLLGISFFLIKTLLLRSKRVVCWTDWREIAVGSPKENAFIGGFLIFFGSLVPFIGIVGFGYHAFADRFTLVPTLGISFAFAALLREISLSRVQSIIVVSLVSFSLVALGTRTVNQIGYWENDGKLFDHTIALDGDGNTMAHRASGLYYWEFEQDMEKVYDHLYKAWNGSTGIEKDKLGNCCQFLITAAYETGRIEKAEDIYFWMNKWNHRMTGGSFRKADFVMAEGVYYANQPGKFSQATECLKELEAMRPGTCLPKYLAYYLAKKQGDKDAIQAALENCPAETGDVYCRNRWARKYQRKP